MKRQGIVLATAAALALLAGCAPYYYDRYGYDGDGYYGGGYGRDGGAYTYRDRYGRRNAPGYGFDRRYRDDGRGYRGDPYRDY
jgi:hypothetical protein